MIEHLKMYNIMASLPTIPEDYKAELTANAIFEITEHKQI